MKHLLKTALVPCICLLLFASCKKENGFVNTSTSPTPVVVAKSTEEMLIGTWTLAQIAEDRNHNNTLEESEITSLRNGETGTMTLDRDNIGVQTRDYLGQKTEMKFTWALQSDDRMIYVTKPNNETVIFYIQKITPNYLSIMDNAEKLDKTWSIMIK